MFYDDFCKTEDQQTVYKILVRLSTGGKYIAFQELSCIGIPESDLKEILLYFEKNGLFSEVRHRDNGSPVIFRLK